MTEKRRQGLKRNVYILFFARAIMGMSVINVVFALFYLHRGVTLSELFYLGVVWSATVLLCEIPSSYLADKWGRKKTLLLGTGLLIIYSASLFVSQGFWMFAGGIVLMAAWVASFSGTDEALIYDSKRELGEEAVTLQSLGFLQSAPRFLKIITPIAGALIAKDLIESQYILILIIDFTAVVIGFVLLLFLTEPNHYMDLEKQEAGTMVDAWRYVIKNPQIIQMIFNRLVLFVASFIIWKYHQTIFTDAGVSIITIGFVWSLLFQLPSFITAVHIHKVWPSIHIAQRITRLNYIFLVLSFIAVLLVAWGHWWHVSLVVFAAFSYVQFIRTPIFSEIFHKYSHSYNRATFISLSNTLKGLIDIPLLLLTGFLVAYDIRAPFVITFVLALMVVFVIRFPKHIPQKMV